MPRIADCAPQIGPWGDCKALPKGIRDSAEDKAATNSAPPDRAGSIRRADVSLRTHYPNLVTRIFEIAPHRFLIVFDKLLQDAAQINFEEIRPVTLQVGISNEAPAKFIREIPPLSDDQLACNFEGFPFNRVQLFNLIAGRFPDLPIVTIHDDGTPMAVTVELTHSLEPAEQQELLDFCNGIGVPAPFKLRVTGRSLKSKNGTKSPRI